jgi:hypothetical protein
LKLFLSCFFDRFNSIELNSPWNGVPPLAAYHRNPGGLKTAGNRSLGAFNPTNGRADFGYGYGSVVVPPNRPTIAELHSHCINGGNGAAAGGPRFGGNYPLSGCGDGLLPTPVSVIEPVNITFLINSLRCVVQLIEDYSSVSFIPLHVILAIDVF